MTGEPGRRDFVDLSPYVGELRVGDDPDAPALDVSRLRFRRAAPPPSPLDGPGYLVVHDGSLQPGAPVLVGSMPHGIAGGVTEWRASTITEVDGVAAPAEGEPGC